MPPTDALLRAADLDAVVSALAIEEPAVDAAAPLQGDLLAVVLGLAGLQAGVAAPGGVIDFIVKRPTNALLRTITVRKTSIRLNQ